ncbi:PC-esterase domain-containing protein 1A-like [Centruroides vittatus]|uniref:PC-esterase domain-containing protein 1A-like n=1 Tax=Centruroides vittatus TaxID=120091 RepID=UPI00351029DA
MEKSYYTEDMNCLLRNKKIVLFGDTNMKALYKDFIALSQHNKLLDSEALNTKMKESFYGDVLIKNCAGCYQERQYHTPYFHFHFYITEELYNLYIEKVFNNMKFELPNIILFNFCLKGIARWFELEVRNYKISLNKLMKLCQENLPEDCLLIWITTFPQQHKNENGLLQLPSELIKNSMCFHVLKANQYTQEIVFKNGYDILDAHYYLKEILYLRETDGIHWFPFAIRLISNLVLSHISFAFEIPSPPRYLYSANKSFYEEPRIKMCGCLISSNWYTVCDFCLNNHLKI